MASVARVDVEKFLLENGFLLTALELYEELLEKNEPSPALSSFFSNPTAVEAAADAVLGAGGGGDGADLSEDVREKEARISLLEHELRVAEEEKEKLERRMRTVDEAGGSGVVVGEGSEQWSGDGLRSYERRVINHLVFKYLMQEYKLTAISFDEEIEDQELDEASDVGVALNPELSLCTMLRAHKNTHRSDVGLSTEEEHGAGDGADLEDVRNSLQVVMAENDRLNNVVRELRGEIERLHETNRVLDAQVHATAQEAADDAAAAATHSSPSAPSSPASAPSPVVSPAASPAPSSPTSLTAAPASPAMDDAVVNMLQSSAPMRELVNSVTTLQRRVEELEKREHRTMETIATSLPLILPNVLLKARDELIPLTLLCIQHHGDAHVRDRLTNMLFNLIKKPDEAQRGMIVRGLVELAKLSSEERLEAELLPQAWEQINHKHPERRVLVADACGALCMYVSVEYRQSLLVSMLQQLHGDTSEMVRRAVASNLTALLPHLPVPDKFDVLWDMVSAMLLDAADMVRREAMEKTLPRLASWCCHFELLLAGGVLGRWLDRVEAAVGVGARGDTPGGGRARRPSSPPPFVASGGDAGTQAAYPPMDAPDSSSFFPQAMVQQLLVQFAVLDAVLPVVYVDVLWRVAGEEKAGASWMVQEAPLIEWGKRLREDASALATQHAQLERALEEHDESMEEALAPLKWMATAFVPRLFHLAMQVHPCNTEVADAFVAATRAVNSAFGAEFTHNIVLPFLWGALATTPKDEFSATHPLLSNGVQVDPFTKEEEPVPLAQSVSYRLWPLLIEGSLAVLDAHTCVEMAYHVLMTVSLEQDGWTGDFLSGVVASVARVAANVAALHKPLLARLWELVVHPAGRLRATAVLVFTCMVPSMDTEQVNKRVLPAFLSLSTDSDLAVRNAVVRGLGGLLATISSPAVVEKIVVQFDAILADPNTHEQVALTLASVLPRAPPHLCETFLVPKLATVCMQNHDREDAQQRVEVATALLDAFQAAAAVDLSRSSIDRVMGCLSLLRGDLAPPAHPIVDAVLAELRAVVDGRAAEDGGGGGAGGGDGHDGGAGGEKDKRRRGFSVAKKFRRNKGNKNRDSDAMEDVQQAF